MEIRNFGKIQSKQQIYADKSVASAMGDSNPPGAPHLHTALRAMARRKESVEPMDSPQEVRDFDNSRIRRTAQDPRNETDSLLPENKSNTTE